MLAPSPRRLTYLGLIGVGVVLAGATALLVTKVVTAAVAVAAVLGAAVLGAVITLLSAIVRLDHRLARLAKRADRQAHDEQARAAAVGAALERLDAHVSRAREWVSRDVFAAYRQLEAVVDLRALIRPRAPMPPLRGWALSPDALRLIMHEVLARQPQLIVECGSGSSSVWLGYTTQQLGTGRIVSLEHDERYADMSRDLLQAHGLDDVVEVRHAPLVPWDGGTGPQPWYDLRAIQDLEKIGLVLVDGPPGTLGEAARYPALPLLLPKCADGALILLDDVIRTQESAVSDRWLAEHPELHRTVHEFEKGLHVFERATP